MEKTGRYAILRQFLADGMTHMFGNPGTVEQGFLDALADFPEMHYILALQESVAVLCADGYARATRKPTLVQLHSSPGIGNAVGALYQAKRGHSPLVVIAGDAGLRYINRLSDFLFVASRYANGKGASDVLWVPGQNR